MQQLRRLFWNDHEARLRALPRLLGQLSLTVLVTFAVILALGNAFSALRDHGPLAALNKQTFDQFPSQPSPFI